MEIYLDNSSDNKGMPSRCRKSDGMHDGCIRNPSSLHSMGFAAEKEMTKSALPLQNKLG